MIISLTHLLSNKKEQLKIADSLLSDELKNEMNAAELFLAPGLIDLQVNGYKGIDFNDKQLSVEKIESAVYALLKDGVTGFLPTLITNDPQIIADNLMLFHQAMEKIPIVNACILGIHLEGPFISASDGAIGAHPKNWIQKPDFEWVMNRQKLSGNIIKIITMAPEYEGSTKFIKECVKAGIRVSIGHTDASIEQIKRAVQAGATLSTHLGNAITSQIHRHNNILYEQMANDVLFASIIADGHHLPSELIKIILRSKPGKVFLVSDSTMFSGMPPGIYETIIGGKVELKENKRLSIFGNEEYLAGAACSLSDCVNFIAMEGLLSYLQAWEMASVIPHEYLFSKDLPSIKEDSVLFSYNADGIKIHLTKKGSKLIF